MTRFWLSEKQAVNLILRSLEETESGTILIPRLFSCNMKTLALAVAYSELLDDSKQVELKTIGTRFGEKLAESLLAKSEAPYADWLDDQIGNYKLIRLNPIWKGRKKEEEIYYRDYNSAEPDGIFDYLTLAKLIKGE
jgi:FlaA1/EpsC-like NDP-sugar epimerase